FETGGEGAGGAIGRAKLRLGTEGVAADERSDYVVGGVGREKYRSAILFVHDGCLTEGFKRFEGGLGVGEQRVARREFARIGDSPCRRAAEAHAIGRLRGGVELNSVDRFAVARDGAL